VISWKTKDSTGIYKIEYDDEPYGAQLAALQHLINIHDELVFCNAKFDLHWLRRYGITFKDKKVYDISVAYFILTRQTHKFPSLDEISEYCGAGKKIDKIKEYWDSGIDTPQIPYNELCEYALLDAALTEKCYLFLNEKLLISNNLRKLVSLAHQDTLVLEEMEWNGMRYDSGASLKEADSVKEVMDGITGKLCEVLDHPHGKDINWDSPKQVSAVLYGGVVSIPYKETYTFNYKDGRTAEKQRKAIKEIIFPRLVEPADRSETDVAGVWSIAEPIISNISAKGKGKAIIDLLLVHAKLGKLHGTYLAGIPKIMDKHGWVGMIHGQLNQTVAVTGRLSSSAPNMQNMPGDVDKYFISRFDDGKVVQFDVKGLEVLCAAYISQDPVLIKELRDGEDIHSNNQAAFKLLDRLAAKRFMFKMIYGGTAQGFAMDADFLYLKMSARRWQEVIDAFYAKYQSIAKWHSVLIAEVLRTAQYTIPSGRELDFRQPLTKPEWYYVPKIKNYPVQGFGADLVKLARISLYKRMMASGCKSLLVNTIHDSIIIDIPEKEWYNISMMVKKVFEDLPINIKNVWEFDIGLKISTEASILTTGEELHD